MATLNELAKECHDISVAHGWYDNGPVNYGEKIALMHTELSEALEEIRAGHAPNEVYYVTDKDGAQKPEGFPVELIDCIIRSIETLYHEGVDVEAVLYAKMAYNEQRPYKHGGKKF